jgi:anti-sigma regulatory factor (Ser/Thr protein kinase)
MTVVTLPHTPASATEARRRLVADLRSQGLSPDDIADAELVLAEMIGNAVRHARPLPDGQLRTDWRVDDLRVTLRVVDGGGETSPTVQRSIEQGEAERGRGLAIVAALASSWGAQQDGATLETWAVLDLTQRPG